MNKVAVLIPVYNNQVGLSTTLLSLKNEQLVDVDVYVIDDGSIPQINCPNKVEKHNVILLRTEKNGGIENALNFGLKIIIQKKYEYIARIDAGDKILNNRFSKQVAFLEKNIDVALVGTYSDYKTIDGKMMFAFEPPTKHQTIKRKMHLNSCFSHPTTMFRTKVVEEIGYYSTSYKSAEDYEFFFRILNKYSVANMNEVLLDQEYNNTGITATRRKQQLFSRLRIQWKYFEMTEINSYIGIAKTILLLFIPRRIVDKLKG